MHCRFLSFFPVIGVLLVLLFSACAKRKTEVVWQQNLPVIGSQSSPGAADLNGDGTLDIVMGAGKNERQDSEQGVLAFDGATGDILWQYPTHDQVFGAPAFQDVNGDGILDVFIGGRSNYLKALDGKTGALLWGFDFHYEQDPILQYARFEFFGGTWVPDQNNDGLQDLLIQNGGNIKAAPNAEEDRYPGVLMLLDAKSGSILAADTMPDGKESYMSPVYYEQPDGSRNIVFGTGGETISGSLYHCSLDDLKNRQLTKAQKLVSENGHGFIAPPTVVDLNGDGFLDIAAISHAATVFGIDGKTLRANWMRVIPQAECSNSIAAGQFTGDDTPELFTFVSKGLWPQNTGSVQILMDGQNGKLLYRDSIGCTGFSSPVVYDLNNDGREEVLLSINEYDCTQGLIGSEKIQVQNRLIAIDFSQPAVQTIEQLAGFKNVFSTPWIGDLDNDGYLDIIHCQYYSPGSDMVVFLGMQIKRISTTVRIRKPVRWGAYMGSKGNGVYGF